MSDDDEFLNQKEKVTKLFKSSMGFPHTGDAVDWYLETNTTSNEYSFGENIFLDDVPSNPSWNIIWKKEGGLPIPSRFNFTGEVDKHFAQGGMIEEANITKASPVLDASDPFNPTINNVNTDYAVVRKYTKLILDSARDVGDARNSYNKLDSLKKSILQDGLQFNYKWDGGAYKPYEYEMTDSTFKPLIPDETGGNWIYDIQHGIVLFNDHDNSIVHHANNPPIFTFCKYIGRKGLNKLYDHDIKFEKNIDVSNVFVRNDLHCAGALYLNQLFVNKLRANDASFNNVDVSGSLHVKGDISANDASFNNVDVSGSLHVKGDISANDASFNNVDVSGILRINENPVNLIAYNEYGLTIEGKTQKSVDISINQVTKIIFDNGTGFNVDLSGTTTAKITLGSHWKTIDISANGGEIATDSSSSLVPSGEETLQIIAGENIILQGKIGSPPTISQSLKISAKTPTLKELGIDVSASEINFLKDVSENIQEQFTNISTRVNGFSGTKIGIINSPPSGNATVGDAKFNTDNDVLYVNVGGNSWRPIIGGTDNSKYHPSNAPVQLLLPIIEQMKDFMETLVFANNKKQTLLNILTQQPETFTLDASYNKGDYISDASNVILRWNYDDIMIHQDGNLTNQLSLFDKATNIPNIDEIFIDISGSMTDNSWNEIKRFIVDDYNTDEFKTFTIKNNESLKYSRRVYNSFLKGDKFQIGIYGKNNAKNYRLKEDRMLIFDCSFANTNDVSYNINTFQINIADLSGNIGNLNFTKNAENDAVLLKGVHDDDMSGNWMKPYDLSGSSGTPSYKWMAFEIDKNSFYIKTAKHKSVSTTINYIDVPLFMKHEGFTNTEINHFGNNTSFIDSSGIVGFIQINALDYNSISKSKLCHFMKNTRTNPMQIWYAGLNPSEISLHHLFNEITGKYYSGLVDTGNYIVDNNWGIQCPRLHKFTSNDIFLVIGIKIQ